MSNGDIDSGGATGLSARMGRTIRHKLFKHPAAVYWSGGLIALDWVGRVETAFDLLPVVKGWHFQALAWVLLVGVVGVLLARQQDAAETPPSDIEALRAEVARLRAEVQAGRSPPEDA